MAFSCFLVGTGGLLVQCGEVLVERGHRVLAVVSPDLNLEHWASRQGVPFFTAAEDCAAAMAAARCDYLFSVRNPWILPGEVLRLTRCLAINYHDAPLPAYPGYNATTWALLAGEPTHGISWHVMTDRVDSGDLVQRSSFPIAPDETAFTLNMKCFEAALAAFRKLLDDIEANRLAPQPMEQGRRGFHRRSDRPAAGGVISWQRSAEELDRLVRALDFAGTPNLLLCPKLAAGDRCFVVRRLEILPVRSTSPPGTIAGLGADALRVATASRDVALRELFTVDGEPIAFEELAAELDLRLGTRLPELAPELAERLSCLSRALATEEAHWVRRLDALEPLTVPRSPAASGTGRALPLMVRREAAARLAATEQDVAVALFTTAFAVALAEASGRARFDIGFRDGEARRSIAELEAIFAAFVPLRIDLEGAGTMAVAAARVKEEVEQVRRHGTYARDLVMRSLLSRRERTGGPQSLPAMVDAGPRATNGRTADAAMVLALGEGREGSQAWLRCGSATDLRWAAELQERCGRLLEAVAGAAGSSPLQPVP